MEPRIISTLVAGIALVAAALLTQPLTVSEAALEQEHAIHKNTYSPEIEWQISSRAYVVETLPVYRIEHRELSLTDASLLAAEFGEGGILESVDINRQFYDFRYVQSDAISYISFDGTHIKHAPFGNLVPPFKQGGIGGEPDLAAIQGRISEYARVLGVQDAQMGDPFIQPWVTVEVNGTQRTEHLLAHDVRIPRLVNDHPAFGVGVKFYMQYREDQEFAHLTLDWPSLAATDIGDRVPSADAIQSSLEDGTALVQWDLEGHCALVHVTKAYVAYDVPSEDGRLVVPHVVIEGPCGSDVNDGWAKGYVHVEH